MLVGYELRIFYSDVLGGMLGTVKALKQIVIPPKTSRVRYGVRSIPDFYFGIRAC